MTTGVEDRPRAELEEERDFLLRSLEDLDRERAEGEIEEADYQALKDDYTARAAAALRAIEATGTVPLPGAGEGHRRPSRGPRRSLRVVAVVVGVAMLAGSAGALVARSAGERLPGDPATGDIAATGPSTAAARDLARARQLTAEGKTLEAIKVYDGVLAAQPDHPEALAYRGWLVRLAGRQAGNPALMGKGLQYLDRAVAADPSYPDAHLFRGLMLYQDKGDPAAAVVELRLFLSSNPPPEMAGLVQDTLRRAEADAAARPAPAGP